MINYSNYVTKTVSLSKGEFRKERTKFLMTIKYRAKANPRDNSRLLSVVEAVLIKNEKRGKVERTPVIPLIFPLFFFSWC